MSTRSRQRIGYSTLVVLVVALIVAVIASNAWLRGARLDLTANGLYTLGKGTHAVLKDIKEPIDLYFFFSNESTKNLQQLRAYATRVRETLEEFAANTPDGRLVLHVVDPVQFSEDEDRAEQFGLQAANIGSGGESVYFGLAGSNSIGKTDTIPFFDPRNPQSLMQRVDPVKREMTCGGLAIGSINYHRHHFGDHGRRRTRAVDFDLRGNRLCRHRAVFRGADFSQPCLSASPSAGSGAARTAESDFSLCLLSSLSVARYRLFVNCHGNRAIGSYRLLNTGAHLNLSDNIAASFACGGV